MKKLFSLAVVLISIISAHAQNDPSAKKILDMVSAKVKSFSTITANFSINSVSSKGKNNGVKSGVISIKGAKYVLAQGKMQVICDGAKTYNFDGAKTITVTSLEESGQSLSPQKILSGDYAKDFTCKLIGTKAGQSEIEIAGLADTTVVVVVPEAGDEVQTMKSGIMEIAHIFVVNKSDRPEADQFVHHLKQMMAPSFSNTSYQIPIIKTIAAQKTGIPELAEAIAAHQLQLQNPTRKNWLLTQKALRLIQQKRMQDINATALLEAITEASQDPQFNIFEFVQTY